MQSGGAINKEEEARFLKMLPGITDSKEMQRQKLTGQRDEMMSRLKTLGFTPQEAGYTPTEFKYGASETPKDPKKDSEAVQWALANPNDPRALKIMEKNGVKVGGR